MNTITEQYEAGYNYIILNNAPKARESFRSAFREHPKHLPFLHGILISYILLNETHNLISFLEQERPVSPHRTLMESLSKYFINNEVLRKKPLDILYCLGVFVREQISATDAKPYFSIGHIIYPSSQQFLISMAEYYIREENYTKGLKLYSQAAELSAITD
ncbi:MAG: hypothetical protein OQK82_08345 [Candidatus Pacearchaeota archaeon]|nr:hypothetical protein [Candidatus Pacearchaeota archaeon]